MNFCKDCKYYVPLTRSDEEGTCHRFPPQVIYAEGQVEGAWPPVFGATDWCGEFKAKASPFAVSESD
jgi:hypothetical protein